MRQRGTVRARVCAWCSCVCMVRVCCAWCSCLCMVRVCCAWCVCFAQTRDRHIQPRYSFEKEVKSQAGASASNRGMPPPAVRGSTRVWQHGDDLTACPARLPTAGRQAFSSPALQQDIARHEPFDAYNAYTVIELSQPCRKARTDLEQE